MALFKTGNQPAISWLPPGLEGFLPFKRNVDIFAASRAAIKKRLVASPLEVTAAFTYIRLHGPTESRYAGSYPTQTLTRWARRIEAWQKSLSDVYVYFNNDVGGHAVENAKKLEELI